MLDPHKNNCQSPQPGPRGRRRQEGGRRGNGEPKFTSVLSFSNVLFPRTLTGDPTRVQRGGVPLQNPSGSYVKRPLNVRGAGVERHKRVHARFL